MLSPDRMVSPGGMLSPGGAVRRRGLLSGEGRGMNGVEQGAGVTH